MTNRVDHIDGSTRAFVDIIYEKVLKLQNDVKELSDNKDTVKDLVEKFKKYSENGKLILSSESVTIPNDVQIVFITAGAGGAAGGYGVIDNEEASGGSGGGSGAGINFLPFRMGKDRVIEFKIGRGGSKPSQAGEDTIIKYGDRVITLGGGKGSTKTEEGGAGGTCDLHAMYNGYSGSPGGDTILDKKSKMPALPAYGGDGGNSLFGVGGKGGFHAHVKDTSGKVIPSIKGLDADNFSAGGGGSSNGIDKELVGKGGDGFAYISW
jgi:hypothetical protein